MRFLFRVVSEAADIARDVIEMLVGIVVGSVLLLATAALRLLVYVIIVVPAMMLLYWVYGMIFHRPLF